MTPSERIQEAEGVMRVVAEEVAPLAKTAAENESYGTIHVSIGLQGGRLNHVKSSFEKIRQGKK